MDALWKIVDKNRMDAARMPGLAGRYLRDVIGRHCFWPNRSPCDTYVRMDRVRNRYSFLTLRFLSSPRHPIGVVADRPYIVGPITYLRHMDDYARLAFGCGHVRFVRRVPDDPSGLTLIHDGSNPRLTDRPWRRIVTLDYDISRTPPRDEAWAIMPYSMHPLTYAGNHDRRLGALRPEQRTIRLFFAGNADRKAYTSADSMRAICKRFDMMNRVEVIDALQGLPKQSLWRLTDETELAEALSGGCGNRCVLAFSGECRVPHSRWLETLARCDVFLAPPGVFMPICHNIIEAMAVGCIPLTNYADWFFPPLTDRVNCLRFRDESELLDRVREVLAFEANEIALIRRSVIEYYEQHLAPETFLERLRANPADRLRLFVNAERRQILERVHPGSVIVAGRFDEGPGESDNRQVGDAMRLHALSPSTTQ